MAQEREESFPDTPEGLAERWTLELTSAQKLLEEWHKDARDILDRYRDERKTATPRTRAGQVRWNLFTANVQTQAAMLYGKTPQVEVGRRFDDAADDIARVAGEMLERLLNSDIERDSDTYAEALGNCVMDRLLPGLSQARVRYVADFEKEEVEEQRGEDGATLAQAFTKETLAHEDVETDYVHWRDYLWSASRVWGEVRWMAYRAEMSRSELEKRFGAVGKLVPLNSKRAGDTQSQEDQRQKSPWARADVWEVWDKDARKVYWVSLGFSRVLDAKPDPLGLEGFFPSPKPILANVTTSTTIPRPDFSLAKDLYNEIDLVSTRINRIERAIKVAGIYDKTSEAVRRLLNEAVDNELLPAERWGAMAEKGGISGAISFLPIDQMVAAVTALRDYRTELINGLYQITGWSDILRGEASAPGVTATEQGIKAKFASVRLQALQDEVARFATDLQKLKAEIIAKHFSVETILERSNAQYTFDRQLAPQAAQLIKSDLACYRIEVKSDSMALSDYAAIKNERGEFLQAMSQFLMQAAPIAQQIPGSLPYLLQMLQWAMSGLRGGSQIEGVLDQAIAAANQMAQQPQAAQAPDPKLQAAQMKAQGDQMKAQFDMQKEQTKLRNDLTRIQAETVAKDQQEASQARWNVAEAKAKHAVTQSGTLPAFTQIPGGTT